MTKLSGTALVTGASKGIGAAAVRRLVRAGMDVIMLARSESVMRHLCGDVDPNGTHTVVIAGDVARYADVERAVAAAEERGGIDLLVNNAGLIDPVARIAESDPDAWGTVVDVNLKGVYHGLRAALPHMAGRGRGTIINISSGAATGALEGWSHYCATKAAVLSLTRCTHKEYAEHGIRVIGLSPGTVATDMQVAIRESGVNPVSQLDWDAHIPPEWVGEAIAWLASDAAHGHQAVTWGEDFSLKTPAGRAAVGLPVAA